MAKLKITQTRSSIGCTETQRATLRGLGLTRTMATVEREDTPSNRGMVKKVIHLLRIEFVKG